MCQQLDWLQSDNYASQVASDNIPAQLKSSRKAQLIEPESLETINVGVHKHSVGLACVVVWDT